MKIAYVAKHNSGGNDDEGAVTHALRSLGHRVICINEERDTYGTADEKAYDIRADMLLFHKWHGEHTLSCLKGRTPRVMWYWDLVNQNDPLTERRDLQRKAWMARTLPHIDLGFMSDGDFIKQSGYDNLVHFFQGADERVIGRSEASSNHEILFTGIRKGGARRMSFVEEMKQRYRGRFTNVENGVHGEELKYLISSARICVAPDAPVTDLYWSNRVYLTLGFGGFLLHPYCEKLAEHYDHGEEIIFYRSREELHSHIVYYMHRNTDSIKNEIRAKALARTLSEHTYRHRCERMLEICRQRLGL